MYFTGTDFFLHEYATCPLNGFKRFIGAVRAPGFAKFLRFPAPRFSAIFNISKLVLVARTTRNRRRREEESREKTPGKLARVAPYQKLKFHSAKRQWALSRSSRGGFAIVSRREIPEAIYQNGVPGIRGSKP